MKSIKEKISLDPILEFLVNKPLIKYTDEFVDLGLPSGTLWADCNLGAESPEDPGDYYSWAETTPKDEYTHDNYKLLNIKANRFTKYSTIDHLNELENEDDAAYLNDNTTHIPTAKQCQELIDSCDIKQTSKGLRITSKTNNNSIFIPCGGRRLFGNTYEGKDMCIYLLTKNLSKSLPAFVQILTGRIHPNAKDALVIATNVRYNGYNIRPVKDK